MNNVRNWASAAVVASLILLAPIIAFIVVVTGEMLGDLVARAGALLREGDMVRAITAEAEAK